MATEIEIIEGKNLTYRGRPLLRDGNTFCYGSMQEKYVLFMMALSTKKVKNTEGKDVEIPEKLLVQVLSTDTTKPPHERVVKQFEKNGLFDAMDMGIIQLERLNK